MGISTALMAPKADVEAFVVWVEAEMPEDGPTPRLLSGWRRAALGDPILRFLGGEMALVADSEAPGGLVLAET